MKGKFGKGRKTKRIDKESRTLDKHNQVWRGVFYCLTLRASLLLPISLSGQTPTITSFSPISGPIGTTVTITGANFNSTPANNIVYFGAINVTPSAGNATSLTVTVPAGATSVTPIVVQNVTTGLQASSITSTTPQFTVTTSPVVPLIYTTSLVAVGSGPRSVALGDFNGDGKADLATANDFSNNVSIKLGDGLGGFSGSTTIAVGTNPQSIAIGDFNGDGKSDFATANYGSGDVSIRIGDGIGGFSGSTSIPIATSPWSIVIGDFNGDGKLDFAVATRSIYAVHIRLGDGIGGFSGTTSFSVGGSNRIAITAADFNEDSKLDLAIIDNSTSSILIRMGDGFGGFSVGASIAVGAEPTSIGIGDFNGDSNPDLAVANSNSNSVSIRLGDGLGGFSGSTSVSIAYPFWIVIGDYNGDGNADFATADAGTNGATIRLGDGLGGFPGGIYIPLGPANAPVSIATGDFNSDGKADLAVANVNTSNVSILRWTPPPPPTITSFTPTTGSSGTTVTITGTNFSTTPANNIVRFNGTPATVTISTTTSLTVTVPAGATSGLISVVVGGLTANSGTSYTVTLPNITAAEYFFNTDPGPGNGTAISITPGTTIDLTNINIPTTSLPIGWHTVHVRARDANNVWGFYESRRVYVREPPPVIPPDVVYPVAQMEFFYNTDNGPGTGTPITITQGDDIDVVNENLANTLPLGWHTIHVRTKNTNNEWGFYESRKIFIRGLPDPPPPPPSPIVELEYFVDADPGIGLSSTKVTINPSQTNIDLVDEPLDVGTQSLGAHKIYVRAKNQAGEWSMSEQAAFSVIAPCSIITAPSSSGVARCDPGPVTLTAAGASVGETYRWYADASTLTPLFTGNPYITASLSANSTFYVTKYNLTTYCESTRSPVTASISGIVKPVLNVSGSLNVCEGTSQVLTAPTGFTSYTWSNGLTTQQITVTTSGSYSVVVNNGTCSSPPSDAFVFTVNVKPLKPTITSTGGGSLCGTGSVTLSAPTGFSSYTWSSGQTTPSIAVSSAGNFTVIVTNAAGCQSVPSDIFTVTNASPTKPLITVTGSTVLCGSGTVQLSAPIGFSTYSWSNGATTQSITTGTAGTYSVIVSNGGCISEASDIITVASVLTPTKPTITITGNTTLCNGAFTVLSAPTGFNNYVWSNGETTRQIVTTTAGTFSVRTGNAANCLSPVSDDVVISINGLPCSGNTPPTAPSVTNASRCGEGTVTLVAAGATTGLEYRWYDAVTGGNLLASTNSYTTLSLTQSIDFYVAIYNPSTLLESSRAKVTATIVSFSKPSLTPDGTASICSGSNLLVEAPVGFSVYRWKRNGTTISNINSQQIFITTDGTYSVETGDGTCFSVPSDELNVSVVTVPAKPVITGNSTVCGSGTVTLTASGSGPYLWSTNETIQTITVGVGTYSVTASNGSCFTTSDEFIVTAVAIPSKPVITTIGKEVICEGAVVALSAPAGFTHYLWSNGKTTQTLVVTEPGSYFVQTGNAADCLSEPSDAVEVRKGTLTECGLVQTPGNDAPEIDAVSFGVQIQSEATYSLTPYIRDEDDNLDITTLRIIDGPAQGGQASGGTATIDGDQNLLLNYRNINFAGKEYITVQVCDLQGVCAQQQLTIDVVGEVLVYNGITPDGDGINDFMFIQFIDIIEGARNNKVTIMNRWGDIVFEMDNYDNSSRVFNGTGTNGKELSGGTYLYKVNLSTGQTYSGFVTIKR